MNCDTIYLSYNPIFRLSVAGDLPSDLLGTCMYLVFGPLIERLIRFEACSRIEKFEIKVCIVLAIKTTSSACSCF